MEFLAWPLAALIFGLVFIFAFRSEVKKLIARLEKIGPTNFTNGQDQKQVVAETTSSGYRELMELPSSACTRESEAALSKELEKRGITNESEKVRLLLRLCAASQVNLRWEQLEHTIFGSQVAVLVTANAKAQGLNLPEAKVMYDAASKQFPETYKNYSFDEYLQFLVNVGLIIKQVDLLHITVAGKEFLSWLVMVGKTHPRPN